MENAHLRSHRRRNGPKRVATVTQLYRRSLLSPVELQYLSVQSHSSLLRDEDITVVKRNLESKQLADVPTNVIRREWANVFKEHYLERLLQVCYC